MPHRVWKALHGDRNALDGPKHVDEAQVEKSDASFGQPLQCPVDAGGGAAGAGFSLRRRVLPDGRWSTNDLVRPRTARDGDDRQVARAYLSPALPWVSSSS